MTKTPQERLRNSDQYTSARYRSQLGTRFKRRRGLPNTLVRQRADVLSGEELAVSPVRIAIASTAIDGTPEHRLVLAVLLDAISILVGMRERGTRCSSRVVAEARDWIWSDDTSWPYAFRNICEALDIDANRLRRRLTCRETTWSNVVSLATTREQGFDAGERGLWCDVIVPEQRTTGVQVSQSH